LPSRSKPLPEGPDDRTDLSSLKLFLRIITADELVFVDPSLLEFSGYV
jgi:hypothetical protein